MHGRAAALVISAGRPGLYMWVAEDPTTGSGSFTATGAGANTAGSGAAFAQPLEWTGFNVAAHHNAAFGDTSLHFSSDTPGGDETTSYTGMVPLPGEGEGGDEDEREDEDEGESAVLLSYDRLANGWSPAPWPPSPLTRGASAIFTVKVNIGRNK